ncbi:MAG: SEL1-like repeat protein [Parachlamydiaceae bacterium]|nr:SEL1-like repeat protein [Parachlamydiaceae bacterium]
MKKKLLSSIISGLGVEKNEGIGLMWMQKSASNGNSNAQRYFF